LRPRCVKADNPGRFTLDGTRTYLVGHRRVAIIDPGPDMDSHVQALIQEVAGAEKVWVLLTHGHADHAGSGTRLAESLDAHIVGVGLDTATALSPGEFIDTDSGRLTMLDTPGHSREHVTFHWIDRRNDQRAAFPGDLVLGVGDTTWVGEYVGCVADYLDSLNRLRALECDILYPAHGPPIEDPSGTLYAYEAHRRSRIRQVGEVFAAQPEATAAELVKVIYGPALPDDLRGAAAMSIEATLDFLAS
jgi:glyoxylase-like metal-dependent hydrolase (beta-lactamase superfamily II)